LLDHYNLKIEIENSKEAFK